MGEQVVQQRRALVLGHVLETHRVAAVDIQQLAAGFRMRAHHRVHGAERGAGGEPGAAFGQAILARLGDIGLGRAVDGAQTVQHPAQTVRQRLVGQVHVGEQRVAPDRRQLARQQHGGDGRRFQIGRVRVPEATEIDPLVRQFDHRHDQRVAVQAAQHGVLDRLGDAPGKRQVLFGSQMLVAKEQHQVLQPGVAYLGQDRVRQFMAQVHSADLRTKSARHRGHADVPVFHLPLHTGRVPATSIARRQPVWPIWPGRGCAAGPAGSG
ncbi:MAG: hypothetical protein OZX49_02105 [Immundisolibacter sp.]|nr:hypothetical protein [Immundisolibacter sp.]